MAEAFRFSIGADGDVEVSSFDELEKWVEKERSRWAWMIPGDGRTDRLNLASELQSTWTQVVTNIQQVKADGRALDYVGQYLSPLSSGPIAVSTTAIGATVLDIRESAGEVAAMAALGFLKHRLTPQNIVFPDEFLGFLLSVLPDMRDPADWTERLKRERANFRMAARSQQERVDAEAQARSEAAVKLFSRGRGIATRIFNIRRRSWRSTEGDWQSLADGSLLDIERRSSASLDSIHTTENQYREFMRLKAPVEYWTEKAESHSVRELSARRMLCGYFPVTAIVLGIIFSASAWFLLSHPDTISSKAPIALYVVVSGGLLLISTLALWIGRLLTKLYLSEHHLRNDAEERATMTTTYLALTGENAAGETDRHIILNALFRATPDGIVKEDGPADIGLNGLLAKALAR